MSKPMIRSRCCRWRSVQQHAKLPTEQQAEQSFQSRQGIDDLLSGMLQDPEALRIR
jgi:hypothetical protein